MLSSGMWRLQELERTLYPLAGGLAHEVLACEYRKLDRSKEGRGEIDWERLVETVSEQMERAMGARLPMGMKTALRKICGLTDANPHF